MNISTIYEHFVDSWKISPNNIAIDNAVEDVLRLTKEMSAMTLNMQDDSAHSDDIKYYVLQCDNEKKTKLFIIGAIIYYVNHIKKNIRSFIGLDFEFNNHKIALNQIAFFYDQYGLIFIVDPTKLDKIQTRIYTETVFTSPIHRIVHGADSLDIPYIFEEFLMRDFDKIIEFTKRAIDTRYLCEYYKITAKSDNRKCSIYDALLFFGTINQNIYDFLNKTNENMGPVFDANWDVNHMTEYHVKYAAYDVFYLKEYLGDIINRFDTELPDSKGSIKFIPSITRLVYFYKWDIFGGAELKSKTDSMNNYYIFSKKGKRTFIKIYTDYLEGCVLEDLGINVNDILAINYFKQTLQVIFKRLLFGNLTQHHKVFAKKGIVFNKKMDNDSFLEELEKVGIPKAHNLMVSFNNRLKRKLHAVL